MSVKKLYRSKFNKKVCGVCGGFAEYLNIDPTIIRILVLILFFTPIPTVIPYFIAALIMPENPNDTIVVDE